jgi:hypothetical protein
VASYSGQSPLWRFVTLQNFIGPFKTPFAVILRIIYSLEIKRQSQKEAEIKQYPLIDLLRDFLEMARVRCSPKSTSRKTIVNFN